MYIHIDTDHRHRPVGGSISHPQKEPSSQISMLIENLSVGLNEALAGDAAEIVPQERPKGQAESEDDC